MQARYLSPPFPITVALSMSGPCAQQPTVICALKDSQPGIAIAYARHRMWLRRLLLTIFRKLHWYGWSHRRVSEASLLPEASLTSTFQTVDLLTLYRSVLRCVAHTLTIPYTHQIQRRAVTDLQNYEDLSELKRLSGPDDRSM